MTGRMCVLYHMKPRVLSGWWSTQNKPLGISTTGAIQTAVAQHQQILGPVRKNRAVHLVGIPDRIEHLCRLGYMHQYFSFRTLYSQNPDHARSSQRTQTTSERKCPIHRHLSHSTRIDMPTRWRILPSPVCFSDSALSPPDRDPIGDVADQACTPPRTRADTRRRIASP